MLTDNDLIVNHVAESAPIGLSDHCIVDFVLNVNCCPDIKHHKADDRKIYKWFDTDFEGFGRHLNSVNWNDFICYNPSAESGWLAFVNLIWEAVDHFVPSFVRPVQGSKFKPHCRQLRKLITKKRHLWKKRRQNPSNLDREWKYRDSMQQYRNLCQHKNKLDEMRIIEANNSWRILQACQQTD